MKYWLVRLISIVIAIGSCFLFERFALGLDAYQQRLIVLAGLYVTLAVSLNLINGITGQFSIGHAAFYQVGAYTAGFLSVNYFSKSGMGGIPWLGAMIVVGAVGAAIAGLVVGLPSLRLRGDYLAIVTLGFGEIIRIVVQNTPQFGGSYGMNVQPKFQPIAIVWMLAIVCIAICRNLLKTAHGLPFLAVREDEVASAAMGVQVTRVKVAAFVLGSAFAGAAGALLAHFEGFITPATFGMDVSFIILTMVVLGGTGSITGSVIAAAFLSYLPEYLRGLKTGDGQVLTLSAAGVVAWLLAVGVAVAIIRWVQGQGGYGRWQRFGLILGAVAAGIVSQLLAVWLLNHIHSLESRQIAVEQLRMVIFSVTLVVLMLLRPQGIFAHHEFSWSWVKRLLGHRDEPTTAVAG